MAASNQIGLLGLGSKSTLHFLSEFNRKYQIKNGGFSTCPMKMLNVDFNEVNPFLPSDFEILDPVVKGYLDQLDRLEVTCMVVPNITLHETIDRLPIYKKIIHPVNETIKQLIAEGIKAVLFLGTKYTMQSQYHASKFNDAQIELISPTEVEIEIIDQFRKDVYAGTHNKEDLTKLIQILRNYSDKLPIVLACTELSLVSHNLPGQIFDMVDIQIEKALETLV